jgi:hypothetical protein
LLLSFDPGEGLKKNRIHQERNLNLVNWQT